MGSLLTVCLLNISGLVAVEAILILCILGILGFWIWALIEVINSSFPDNEKLTWLLIVVFFGALGAYFYYILGRKQRIMDTTNTEATTKE